MYNRIGDSSILLTASSQSEHGIRQNPFIYYRNYKRMKFINFSLSFSLPGSNNQLNSQFNNKSNPVNPHFTHFTHFTHYNQIIKFNNNSDRNYWQWKTLTKK